MGAHDISLGGGFVYPSDRIALYAEAHCRGDIVYEQDNKAAHHGADNIAVFVRFRGVNGEYHILFYMAVKLFGGAVGDIYPHQGLYHHLSRVEARDHSLKAYDRRTHARNGYGAYEQVGGIAEYPLDIFKVSVKAFFYGNIFKFIGIGYLHSAVLQRDNIPIFFLGNFVLFILTDN